MTDCRPAGLVGIIKGFIGRMVVCWALLTSLMAGCTTTPGAIAPATLPIHGLKYVPLGETEEASSCGYTLLTIPFKNPKPLATVIDEMIKGRAGEALIEVSSSSSTVFYLVGVANCLTVRGRVVNIVSK
jgi:hypothetical protein